MPGELLQKLGEDGARRAKVWLDSTTRVKSSWSVYDKVAVGRLSCKWPHGGKRFSYDLGGIFHGGELEQEAFLAECKKYSTGNQGHHFDKFLAQSYVTLEHDPGMAHHFLWITWHPFRISKWNELYSEEAIRDALVVERERVFGEKVSEDDAKEQIRADIVADLATRVWIIVLSDRQETLVISTEDRAELMKIRTLQGGS